MSAPQEKKEIYYRGSSEILGNTIAEITIPEHMRNCTNLSIILSPEAKESDIHNIPMLINTQVIDNKFKVLCKGFTFKPYTYKFNYIIFGEL